MFIPLALLCLNTSIGISYTSIISAAFNDERIFPFSLKNSGVAIMFLISKVFNIGVPFANEASEPTPIIIMTLIMLTTLGSIQLYKSKKELDSM